jgi:Chaperone of endosialidase
MVRRLAGLVAVAGLLSAMAPALRAQALGTFRWQVQPYCNVVTLSVHQDGGVYTLDGVDDQCGAAGLAAVSGLAFLNPDGSIGFGLTVVTAPGGRPLHLDATITLATLGGTWRDHTGATGSFVFNPPLPAAGSPRPTPIVAIPDGAVTASKIAPNAIGSASVQDGTIGAADVNPAQVQRRVTGLCGFGGFVQSVNADGSVGCSPQSLHYHAVGDHALNNIAVGEAAMQFATGNENTAVGRIALWANTTGALNTGVGASSLTANRGGSQNTALGAFAMSHSITGDSNLAVGSHALFNNQSGEENTAVGARALLGSNTASRNTAVGSHALSSTRGSGNLAVGDHAGSLHQLGLNNIYIGHPGESTESNTIRLGTVQTATYVAGIYGRSSSGGTAVFINSLGKLGTTLSSRRFKDRITALEDLSARVQALRPVTFYYKPDFDDGTGLRQYGLIAEEVDEVLPDLVVRDAQGRVETVRYHFLNTLLLAEVQRLERERADQHRRLTQQAREIEELRAMVESLIQRR